MLVFLERGAGVVRGVLRWVLVVMASAKLSLCVVGVRTPRLMGGALLAAWRRLRTSGESVGVGSGRLWGVSTSRRMRAARAAAAAAASDWVAAAIAASAARACALARLPFLPSALVTARVTATPQRPPHSDIARSMACLTLRPKLRQRWEKPSMIFLDCALVRLFVGALTEGEVTLLEVAADSPLLNNLATLPHGVSPATAHPQPLHEPPKHLTTSL
ncbi:hypothetical protein B1813_00015 [Saccharomonospora piscinae]|uniref:Uncharacterized protein n=1 Tax=Saccharomonospora piscinae TaxID=687388 RepID=A0A1V9ABU2_SACPI|nr:hypothetical protein B1813_00015 [Saccharomonospora piscinae]